MKFTLESGSNQNLIRTYGADGIRIGEQVIRRSCVVTAETIITDWPPATLDELTVEHLQGLFALKPELVLLGTGTQLRFAPALIRAEFAQRRVGLETMDLGAACRTFNILLQEERRVAAALFLT